MKLVASICNVAPWGIAGDNLGIARCMNMLMS